MPSPLRSRNFPIAESGLSADEQLDARVADADHRLLDALLRVGLAVHEREAERAAVELDGGVEVAHGEPDVVDGGDDGSEDLGGGWVLTAVS